jgi:small conductance mechanosensitive channel
MPSLPVTVDHEAKSWIDLIQDKVYGWYVDTIKILPNLVVAIIIWSVAYFVAKLVRRLMHRLMFSISQSQSISSLIANLFYILVFCIGLFCGLNVLKLNKTVTTLLAGAGVIGLALGFAFQDLTANLISGIFIAFHKPFQPGDVIKTTDYTGRIEKIELRSTTMRTFDGLHILMPNKNIFQNPITNYSRTPERRIEIDFSVPGKDSITDIKKIIGETLGKSSYAAKDKEVEFYITDIDQANLKVKLLFWVDNRVPHGFMQARHNAISDVLNVLKANNISLQ